MTENEKYGIQIEAETNLFKKKMQELANYIRNFGKEAEKETSVMPTIDTNDYESRIERIQDKLDALKDVINGIKAGKIEGNADELQKEYDQLLIKLASLKKEQEDYNKELKEMGDDGKKSTSMLSSLFDKSIGKIKRFTYYLLGARSVFSLFMRYRSIYYQFNEEMMYQSELSQNAIALSLAPAFEFLGNMVTYASIGLAKFVELLTGVNVLSKVTTKGIRDYNKSLKETQTLASGIDEITNLSLPSGTGLASQYSALEEFQKKVAEVTEWFDNQTWLKNLAKWIKDGFGYIVDNWDKLKYLFLGIGVATAVFDIGIKVSGLMGALGTVGTMGTVAGTAGTGLAGLAGVLGYLATLGGIAIGVAIIVSGLAYLYEATEELNKLDKQTHDMWLGVLQKYPETFKAVFDRLKDTTEGTDEWNKDVSSVKELMQGVVNAILHGKLEYEEYEPIISGIQKQLEELGEEEFAPELQLVTSIVAKTSNDAVLLNYLKTGNVNLKLNPEVTWGKDGTASSSIFGNNKLDNTKYTPHAKGLDYVPYDEYPALLHKGEAVVPAKYNPTIHSQGNEYTNSLLETLIVSVQDLANRPNVFEVDGNEFAKATYPLYRSEENRQNYNAKVSVK